MDIRAILERYNIMANDAEISDFERWAITDAWNKYKQQRMYQRGMIEAEVNSAPISVPNGTKGKLYNSGVVKLPPSIIEYHIEGVDELGLHVNPVFDEDAGNAFVLEGIPSESGDFSFVIKYKYMGWIEGDDELERKVNIAFNPNPRDLWKDIPTPADVPFYKPDTDTCYLKVEAKGDLPRKDIVAASARGRSHANEGRARDDHFKLYHDDNSDWYVIAVADGAGSAQYSRRGSMIACDTVVDFCRKQLSHPDEFETNIRQYKLASDKKDEDPANEEQARKVLGNHIYNILGNASFKAHKAIKDEASKCEGSKAKDFATTLLLAVCKKFDFGWFIATFWVGDGALCLYNRDKQMFKILGVPDEGEFSGQTRFLTMPEIFTDYASLFQRTRFVIEDDFTALMLMTDGVSDPMFGTDANLNNIDKWNEFWDMLLGGFPEDNIPGVDLSDDNVAAKDQLLQWLGFWRPGEHDDRTIAILY